VKMVSSPKTKTKLTKTKISRKRAITETNAAINIIVLLFLKANVNTPINPYKKIVGPINITIKNLNPV